MTARNYVHFNLNGKEHRISGERAYLSLSRYLRETLKLTGTKIVCEEGDCGACTVLAHFPHQRPTFSIVNSCLIYLTQLDGAMIITIEGVNQLYAQQQLSPVQQSFTEHHGSQCGYCTPGFVLSASAYHDNHKEINESSIRNNLTGNLCRCTGYRDIIRSVSEVDRSQLISLKDHFLTKSFIKWQNAIAAEDFTIETPKGIYYGPKSQARALSFLQSRVAQFVAGGSDLHVIFNKCGMGSAPYFLSLQYLPELKKIKCNEDSIEIGSMATIHEIQQNLGNHFHALKNLYNYFASPQIKNIATLGGNITNASPVADSIPFLLMAEAKFNLISPQGERSVCATDFFQSYKKVDLNPSEFLASITLDQHFLQTGTSSCYKVSRRKDMDISAVVTAFWIKYSSDNTIEEFRVALGGVAETTIRCRPWETYLKGKKLTDPQIFEGVKEIIKAEIHPISDVRAKKSTRRLLLYNLFQKFISEQEGGR